MKIESLYQTYKPLLFSIAYHMLGSVSDAEDVVQECFLAVYQLDEDTIRDMKAYLSKMVTNRCINLLKSARKKREVYVGEWLPEPLVQDVKHGPQDQVECEETISYAVLILLENFSPPERAVFVLREVFGYTYREIASILERSEASCRKIYSRLKQRMQQLDPATDSIKIKHEGKRVKEFINALVDGKIEKILELLTEDVVFISDGGGKVKAAINPIVGRSRVLALLGGIAKRFVHIEAHLQMINGQVGILFIRENEIVAVMCFDMDPKTERFQKIYFVLNPDKLKHIHL
ncbi:RNA polymerase sigma-70 factor [Thermoflavimicrobium dichotomicum]|uniref:RNA polymerase sigma-70 factor, ECF subfamily n=1 Tax=Thermoflavimicrobium dichotomicum TaxID=46223 RepID=A0A1I3U9K5_9BACL|nr:RNA polymerase sigma-70 factor [Thermoflavimicrobium dichotomicum]SFJ78441.1 RNA polymerase sigma-70 factor, ECF subfamily [Thermoflavimicrobium dichotomicum]